MTNKEYRIEGNALIINEGVTNVEGKDFHIYENGYSSLKDEFKNIKKVINKLLLFSRVQIRRFIFLLYVEKIKNLVK